jgi:putative flippase GtrA
MTLWYQKLKALWWGTIERIHPDFHRLVFTYRQYLKYLISGGTAAFVNLFSITLFVEVVHMHYLPASVLAFSLGFVVSFVLQKFFTFGNTVMHLVHRQLVIYFAIAMGNLTCNTLLVYLFVDLTHLGYFLSQALSGVIIAITSFILYRKYVFVRPSDSLKNPT